MVKLVKVLVLGGLMGSQVWWVKQIDYPATFNQIDFGLANGGQLWILRAISLGLLILATYGLSRLIDSSAKFYYWLLVMSSPTMAVIWMAYPWEAIKVAVLALIIVLSHKKLWLWPAVIVSAIGLLWFVNLTVLHQHPAIGEALSLKRSTEELTWRFRIEDSIRPNIQAPLLVRRLAYNKYFISLKNCANQVLTYFNFENLFFQEVNPIDQKSIVFFYWPEMVLLILAIGLLAKEDHRQISPLWLVFGVGLLYFLMSNGDTIQRMSFSVWCYSLLIALGLSRVRLVKGPWLSKLVLVVAILVVYGFATNFYDRTVRPMRWLDNRPIAYRWLFESIKQSRPERYRAIYVADLLGNVDKYCRFYLGDCRRVSFDNFNFGAQKMLPQPASLYGGFVGNFLGPNYSNSFSPKLRSELSVRGFDLVGSSEIRDNIADKYGQTLVVAESDKR